eukprot:638755-Alexandrium_andersonii.AAC.1
MAANYCGDEVHYRPRPDRTPADLLRLHGNLIRSLSPPHWWERSPPQLDQLPRPYQTHKGKCLFTHKPGLR